MAKSDLQNHPLAKKKILFLGIGGYGMRGLAEICHDLGWDFIGYDRSESINTRFLEAMGITISMDPNPDLLNNCDIVIYSTAVKADHPLRKEASQRGLQILHRSEFLKLLMQSHYKILVSGTHGKTTTTAMIGHMLEELGLNPTVYAGGVLRDKNRCAYAGKGNIFVAEIDESDGSFLQHDPDICIITNIDLDHLDYFGGVENLLESFKAFAMRTDPENGFVVLGWNSRYARDLFPKIERQTLTYGSLIGCDVRAYELQENQGNITFKAVVERDEVHVDMPAIGLHSCLNTLASLAIVKVMELDQGKAVQSFKSFAGVDRRHSCLYQRNNLWLLDDYAHNPGKISSSVQAVKNSWPQAKLICVFEPHRYSRLSHMMLEFASAFKEASRVYVMPVYAAGESEVAELSPVRICQHIVKHSRVESSLFKSIEGLASDIRHDFLGQKVILFLGAGDSSETAHALAEILN